MFWFKTDRIEWLEDNLKAYKDTQRMYRELAERQCNDLIKLGAENLKLHTENTQLYKRIESLEQERIEYAKSNQLYIDNTIQGLEKLEVRDAELCAQNKQLQRELNLFRAARLQKPTKTKTK